MKNLNHLINSFQLSIKIHRGISHLFTLFLLILTFFNSLAIAQWSTDPNTNNPITTASDDQITVKIVSDGSGGAIIVWADNRNGNWDIYAQRINSSGIIEWTTNGVPICSAPYNQTSPAVISDGTGGAIIVWQDLRNSNNDIYAQRINSSGVIQWTTNGIPVCTTATNQYNPDVTSDGSNGAIITWQNGDILNADIYAQRVDGNGNLLWNINGVVVCGDPNASQGLPKIVSDGSGGAIVVWLENPIFNEDIYAQRINGAGDTLWTSNDGKGIPISTAIMSQNYHDIISDGSGGAIVVWQDFRSLDMDIYAQRINSSGVVQWTNNGVVIIDDLGAQEYPKIISDNSNGAIIVWQDNRSGTSYDIYVQRINSSGVAQWTTNGVAICTVAQHQEKPDIIGDGFGGAIIVWQDNRNWTTTNYDIFAQRIDIHGNIQWTSNGVPISTATNNQEEPVILSLGSGEAIISWLDFRNGSDYDIYASKLLSDGVLPVHFQSFNIFARNFEVILHWSTATEVNNFGFEIERKNIHSTSQAISKWEKIGFVKGNGNSNSPKEYSFIDKSVKGGKVKYRIKQIDNDGSFNYSPEIEVEIIVPREFSLKQNFPNPFNPKTTISFTLDESGLTTLKIYTLSGAEVATLIDNKYLEAGEYHQVEFDGSRMASGIYIARLEIGNKAQMRKLMLIK
jgi:predicted lipoprotein with Yx(FWY)xxD motif